MSKSTTQKPLSFFAKLKESPWYQKFSDWKMITFCKQSKWLAITYDNQGHKDGAGAQLQRIYGVYALSRFLKVYYIHTPLSYIDYQGISALESNSFNHDVASQYNQIFSIPSDINCPDKFMEINVNNISLSKLIDLKSTAEKNKIFTLVKIRYPYNITDSYPHAYEVLKSITPFNFSDSSNSQIICIAVHVRRGDLTFIEQYNKRILPNNYYIQIMQQLSQILTELNVKYEFELYTELPTKTFTISPEQEGLSAPITESIIVDPSVNKIEEFDVIPNLKKFINTDAIEAMEKMASAHIVVISHSSFSYLPSLLNQKGIIIYHKFWHSPLQDWIIADDNGDFSTETFTEKFRKNFNLMM